ncbi:MAG: DEAD/DEAH box helicase [Thermoleophilia bacterium]|nr:DEAD/DEAH box helicase [Thermoleophilia bacterium]
MTRPLFEIFLPSRFPQVQAAIVLPGREGKLATVPAELHPALAEGLTSEGISYLWRHQAECWEVARRDANFVVTTGTASGKSLCFNLPVLDTLLRNPQARAIYIYPTKALAQDQLRRLRSLVGTHLEVVPYDGDTPRATRQFARKKARILLTNPDMLHVSILPHHELWGNFFLNLRYIVIDEAHTYRGVFGSNVANVFRRLRRVASLYGADPRFILASATIRNAQEHARSLTGLDAVHISGDGAPVGARQVVFWQPPLVDEEMNLRRSASSEAALLMAELISQHIRTICFAKSRRAAEVIYQQTVEHLEKVAPHLRDRVSPYRAGYTPEQRRAIEAMLFAGDLLGVVSTSALELGIDVGALDAAITVGYPGTMASLWQQWGRAGRSKSESLAIFVAGNDALEQFFVKHPSDLLQREVEAATIDFANPYVHAAHLAAAAYEYPLTLADEKFFGPGLASALEKAETNQVLRRRKDRWHPTDARFPAGNINLRSTTGGEYTIVEEETGDIVGTEGSENAFAVLHPGAVYLHMGDAYLVTRLDIEKRIAFVRPFFGPYYTVPRRDTETRILAERMQDTLGPVRLHLGEIAVTTRVTAYQKRHTGSDEVLGTEDLDLPPKQFVTEAVWFTIAPEVLPPAEAMGQLPGAVHAVEHAMIALLPLYAMCDRWDIGGLSTPAHAQTGQPTIFIYDGHAGGVGISRQGFNRFAEWIVDARNLIRDCACEKGCPSCIQSPKCGNWNEPLDKKLALQLLNGLTEGMVLS